MRRTDWFLAVSVMVLWGFNFSVIKLGTEQMNPIMLTTLRFMCAVFPAILFIPKPQVAARYLIAYGLCFGLGVWGMMTSAVHAGLSAGMAGFLMQLSVLFSVLFGLFFFKERLQWQKWLGVGLVVAGVLLSTGLQDGSVPLSSLIYALVAALCWTLISVIVKAANTPNVFAFSVWGMAFAPVPLLVMAWGYYGVEVFIALPQTLNGSAWFSILFQAYPTTLLGYWLWNRIVSTYPLSTTALLTPLVPVFGMVGSAVFYAEQLSWLKLAVAALILAGLLISQARFPSFGWTRFRASD